MRSGTDDVRIGALETVGNLSFQLENRVIFLADADLLEWIYRLARDQVYPCNSLVADDLLVRRQFQHALLFLDTVPRRGRNTP